MMMAMMAMTAKRFGRWAAMRTAAERGQGQIDSAELMPLGASEDESWRRRVRVRTCVWVSVTERYSDYDKDVLSLRGVPRP
jgi:hypothetical protein